MLSIGFLCEFDPKTGKSWSGTHHTLFTMLSKKYDVEWINSDPFQVKLVFKTWMRLMRLVGKNFDWMHAIPYSKYLCRNAGRKLRNGKFDLLYAPAGSESLAFLDTDIPVIYHSDTTFRLAHDYHRDFSDLGKGAVSAGELLERRALQRSRKIILTSQWAKRSAIEDYGIDEENIEIIPFAPNMENVPSRSQIRFERVNSINLLFVGTSWKRKGGPMVLTIYRILKMRYPNCRLSLAGEEPDEIIDDTNVTSYGFLRKDDPHQLSQLYSLYLETDFFILPTQSDAAGIVFCEASAFGVPSLTFDTGGTSQYVENNVNGFTFPQGTGASAFADVIAEVYEDPSKYRRLRESSRRKFEQDFSQERWLERFQSMLKAAGIA